MTPFKNLLVFLLLSFASSSLHAWGQIGHKVVGAVALENLSKNTKRNLYQLLGTSSAEEITQWCIWPDAYRATDEGSWTAPLHYVNIPQEAAGYDMARDCNGGMCVTEAIGRFTLELGNASLPVNQRREAFGFVCHFVGDLSQPLHAGFGSDRGGNDFFIIFNGVQQNLHRFWDSTLIDINTWHWKSLGKSLQRQFSVVPTKRWQSNLAVQWTNQSYGVTKTRAYPENPEVSTDFINNSWYLMQQQLASGGRNLATVLNTVLNQQPSTESP